MRCIAFHIHTPDLQRNITRRECYPKPPCFEPCPMGRRKCRASPSRPERLPTSFKDDVSALNDETWFKITPVRVTLRVGYVCNKMQCVQRNAMCARNQGAICTDNCTDMTAKLAATILEHSFENTGGYSKVSRFGFDLSSWPVAEYNHGSSDTRER